MLVEELQLACHPQAAGPGSQSIHASYSGVNSGGSASLENDTGNPS